VVKAIEAAAKTSGIGVQHVKVQAPADFSGALLAISKSRDSLLVLGLPGGLMAYGANRSEMWRHLVINLR